MKIAIYTSIFGNYDRLRKPRVINPNIDYFCFTDNDLKCKPWKIIKVKPQTKNLRLENRRYKILANKFLNEYDYLLYLDGNFIIKDDLSKYFEDWLKKSDIAFIKHPKRNCIYEEFEALLKLGIVDNEKLINQRERYKKNGHPKNYGLASGGIILRRNNSKITEFNEMWWNEVIKYTERDQVSLMYCLYKLNIKFNYINLKNKSIVNNDYFKYKAHGSKIRSLKYVILSLLNNIYQKMSIKS